ncbi:CRTAM protein, partial [Certhia brachydactyla]|nr:CRTAM protein [Certhia brachydactyla]
TNPCGVLAFLFLAVLRDQRYKLLRYSKEELSIQLTNVTVQDEGIYSCFYYSRRFQSKSQNVEILAAPSHPVLEVSQDSGRGIKLSCSTQGSKPQPQISWLLDNGIELSGDTRHQLGADGKKWSTSSTLRILSYSPKVTASCIIQHPALRGERLMASLHFQDLPSMEDAKGPSPSESPAVSSSPESPAEVLSPSSSPENPEVQHQHQPSQTSPMSHLTVKQNPHSKGMVKKEKNLLLPILVAALIFVLLIIVLLFLVKLKKAHGVWKRENDVSEQTLESYKSRSNEDSPGHEKNG